MKPKAEVISLGAVKPHAVAEFVRKRDSPDSYSDGAWLNIIQKHILSGISSLRVPWRRNPW